MSEIAKLAPAAISIETARQYLDALDLTYIVEKMCDASYPLPRWTLADAQHCCQLYKNFLFLQKKYPRENLVPTREIDEFWHNHILHTQKYLEDCSNIFGHYFHHQPADITEKTDVLVQKYLKTKDLYLKEFNIPLALLHKLKRPVSAP